MLSLPQQISLCLGRGFQRLRSDATVVLTGIIGNNLLALVIASEFYNMQADSLSMQRRSVLLYFALLINAFASNLEVISLLACVDLTTLISRQIFVLFAQRNIVEKQSRYAFYHPTAEAISSMLCDLPNKILNSICFNLVLYFLSNLRRTPSAFFVFLLFSFAVTTTMSMLFRTCGAIARSVEEALCPAALLYVVQSVTAHQACRR